MEVIKALDQWSSAKYLSRLNQVLKKNTAMEPVSVS